MDMSNPRRIMAVSLEGQAHLLSQTIKDLTGSAPEPASTSLAGTTHSLRLETRYYTATLPVWLDLVAMPSDWAASFLSDEAAEVLAVLGGLMVVFALPAGDEARSLIRHVGRVVGEGLGGWEWDGVRLAVGVGAGGDDDEWDEMCADAGMEFVRVGGEPRRNEFGEKTGLARVREALEANDWAQADAAELSDAEPDGDAEPDPENLGFGFDRADFDGLRQSIWTAGRDDDDDDDEVAKVEGLMRKLQAVRDAGAGVGEAQRRSMAARAVAEVMREL